MLRYLAVFLLLPFSSAAQSTSAAWTWVQRLTNGAAIVESSFYRDQIGNLYLAGNFTEPITLSPTTVLTPQDGTINYSGRDSFVAKYDATGHLVWAQQIRGPRYESVSELTVDAVGNVYIMGYFGSSLQLGGQQLTTTSDHYSNIYLAKLDQEGQPVWLRQGAGTGSLSLSDLGVDTQGNTYLTGHVEGSVTLGSLTLTSGITATPSTERDIFLVKYDAQGTAIWARQGGRTRTGEPYMSHGMVVAPTGEVYLECNVAAGAAGFDGQALPPAYGMTDLVIVKYTAQGTVEWIRRFGGPGEDVASASTGTITPQGNLAISVFYQKTATFGTYTLAMEGSGWSGGLLLLDSRTGNPLWAQALAAVGTSVYHNVYYTKVATDTENNVYVVGSFNEQAKLGTTLLTSTGGRDAVLVKYSPQGAMQWVQQSTGTGDEYFAWLDVRAGGQIYVAGGVSGTTQFGPHTFTSQAQNISDCFLARVDQQQLVTRNHNAGPGARMTVYPNPAQTTLTLHLAGSTPRTSVYLSLLNATGHPVYQQLVSNPRTDVTMAVGQYPTGLYLLRVEGPNGFMATQRVILE